VTDRAALIEALRATDGVADAEIVDDERGVGTLRLTLVPGADEVDVAVRVNTVLREGFDLAVDSGKVQVVEETWSGRPPSTPLASPPQSASTSAGPVPPREPSLSHPPTEQPATSLRPMAERRAEVGLSGNRRMAIRRLQLVSTSAGISTAVSLGLGARTFVGEAEAGSTPDSVQRAVAVATLRAVTDVLGDHSTLELVHVEVAPVADEWVALVVAQFLSGGAEPERLTGAAVVREDVRQAVIRATLDAVNRRVEAVLASLGH
jgi:hypothetical protein